MSSDSEVSPTSSLEGTDGNNLESHNRPLRPLRLKAYSERTVSSFESAPAPERKPRARSKSRGNREEKLKKQEQEPSTLEAERYAALHLIPASDQIISSYRRPKRGLFRTVCIDVKANSG